MTVQTIQVVTSRRASAEWEKPPSTPPLISHEGGQPARHTADTLRVLVVDDDVDLAEITQTLLECLGVITVCAYSVESALGVLERDQSINVVFSDVMMPRQTGLDLARIMSARHPDVGLVLTSGYTPADLVAANGVSPLFVNKPYKIMDVLDILLKAIPE